jgi:hypothetical protein
MSKSNEIIQIEEIDKGLTKLNQTLGVTADNYLKLVKTIAGNTQAIKENTTSYDGLEKAQKKTKEEGEKLDNLAKQLQTSEKKLKELTDERTQKLIANRLEIQKVTKELKDKQKADQAEEGSLVRMRQKLIELNQAYDKSGTRTKAAANEINKLSKEIQDAEFATNRHQRNVGNYADAISGLPGPIGNAASGLQNLTTKMAALGPVGMGIATGILAMGAPLAAFFTQSERGVEMLERKFAGVKASFSVLVGELINGGAKMAESFEEPIKAQTFWTMLLRGMNPAFMETGVRMDAAAVAAENYTKKTQELEDAERALIVPRAQANLKIKEAMMLYNDETKSIDQRMNGLKQAIDLENKTADTEIEHQKQTVLNIKEINRLKELNGMLRDSDDQKLQEAMARQIDLETESVGRSIRISKRLSSARKEMVKEEQDRAKAANEKVMAEEKEKVKGIEKSLDDQMKSIEESIKDRERLESQRVEIALDSDQKVFDNWYDLEQKKKKTAEKLADDIVKEEEKKAEKIKDIQFQMASDALNGVFDMSNAGLEKQLSDLDKEKEAKLSNENITKEEKLRIEQEYDKKSGEIKKKQANADKLQALFQIALDTAKGSMKAVAEFPLTGGMPFLAWVIASGVLQSAMVAAKPIPEFADGTNNAPDKGIFGEAGREIMRLRSGETILADSPTYFQGSKFKGAQIKSNPETERLLSAHSGNGQKSLSDERILKGLQSVERAIVNKPVQIVNRDYQTIGQGNSRYQQIYLNKLTYKN